MNTAEPEELAPAFGQEQPAPGGTVTVNIGGQPVDIPLTEDQLAGLNEAAPDLGEDEVPYLRVDSEVGSTFRIDRDGVHSTALRDNEDDHELAVFWDFEVKVYRERPDYFNFLAARAEGRAEKARRVAEHAPASAARTSAQRQRDAARRAARAVKKR